MKLFLFSSFYFYWKYLDQSITDQSVLIIDCLNESMIVKLKQFLGFISIF